MRKLEYTGPLDQVNLDVAAATGDGRMTPGRVLEVDSELAGRLLASSEHYRPLRNLADLSKAQLLELAGEADVDGRSSMTKDQLVAALRSNTSRSAAAQDDTSPGPGADTDAGTAGTEEG